MEVETFTSWLIKYRPHESQCARFRFQKGWYQHMRGLISKEFSSFFVQSYIGAFTEPVQLKDFNWDTKKFIAEVFRRTFQIAACLATLGMILERRFEA